HAQVPAAPRLRHRDRIEHPGDARLGQLPARERLAPAAPGTPVDRQAVPGGPEKGPKETTWQAAKGDTARRAGDSDRERPMTARPTVLLCDDSRALRMLAAGQLEE